MILLLLALAALAFGLYAASQRRRAEHTLETATRSAKTYVKDVATSLRIAKGLPLKDVDRLMAGAENMLDDLARYDPGHPDVVSAHAMLLREKSQTALGRGETCAALAFAKAAMAMLAGLPESRETLEERAFGHNRLGDAYRRVSRQEDAIVQYREALKSGKRSMTAARTRRRPS